MHINNSKSKFVFNQNKQCRSHREKFQNICIAQGNFNFNLIFIYCFLYILYIVFIHILFSSNMADFFSEYIQRSEYDYLFYRVNKIFVVEKTYGNRKNLSAGFFLLFGAFARSDPSQFCLVSGHLPRFDPSRFPENLKMPCCSVFAPN